MKTRMRMKRGIKDSILLKKASTSPNGSAKGVRYESKPHLRHGWSTRKTWPHLRLRQSADVDTADAIRSGQSARD